MSFLHMLHRIPKKQPVCPVYIASVFAVFIGVFDDSGSQMKLFCKKSCAVFFCAYYHPPCSKQNELQSE